ncbi:MAG: Gfo/Idh/MocA family oxidoreductase [Gaiellaceae bacterium]
MASPLHVGVIGVGRIGAFHAATLRSLEGVGALTVTDADGARAAQVARGLEASTAETPEALVEAGVEALVIATPTGGHASMLGLAADAGLPAFCEKPVALDIAALDNVIEHVDRAGIFVQIGFQRRFDAGYRAAHDAVATGVLGNLLVLRAATHDASPPEEAYIATSGGIFRDLHIHDFDALHFVTGRQIVEVYADGAVRETAWFDQHGDVDAAASVLRLEGGALAIVSGTRHDPLGYDVRLEVFGSADSIVVGLDPQTPLRSVEPGAPPGGTARYRTFLDRFEAAYRAELAAFVDSVHTGSDSPCTLRDARAALLVALAADRSRAERRPVSIEEVVSAEALSG